MKYVLLIDPIEEILQLQAMSLKCYYGGEILMARHSSEAKEILEGRGVPELIVSDSHLLEAGGDSLYSFLQSKSEKSRLIICSPKNELVKLGKKYPDVSGFIEKPISVQSFNHLVKSITTSPAFKEPTHVPVYLSILEKFVGVGFDLYLKLSETNFVKILNKEESFTKDDAERLIAKGITELHINFHDSADFLRTFEKNLYFVLTSQDLPMNEQMNLAIDSIENLEQISRQLGWTPEVILQTQRSIHASIGILSKDSKISEILKAKLSKQSSKHYTGHVGLLAYLCCAFSTYLGWSAESAQLKLTMAAMIHDMAVDDTYYKNIAEWNKKASEFTDKTPEVVKYRHHPFEASRLIQSLDVIPPDVDQIILQHHELKDGTGFPRGLTSNRISHLATLFIIVEDFIDFIGDKKITETSIADFITWGDSYYDSGNFKKIYSVIREKLK